MSKYIIRGIVIYLIQLFETISSFSFFNKLVSLSYLCQDQLDKEIQVRRFADLNRRHVMEVLPGPTQDEFAAAVSRLGSVQGKQLSLYKYGIVMPPGDRSLQAVYLHERPDLNHVRTFRWRSVKLYVICMIGISSIWISSCPMFCEWMVTCASLTWTLLRHCGAPMIYTMSLRSTNPPRIPN